MQVGLVTGKRQIELRELPSPEPSVGCAVVEIAYCGICGTDLHAWQSGAPYNPAICGHEWSGTVRAVGPNVRRLREGDRVGVGVIPACGACRECRAGNGAQCSAVLGCMLGLGPTAPAHGGFASAIAVDAARLYRLLDAVSLADAALLEPATVALHALRRTPIRLGDSAVVLGAGPIGLLVMQCARIAGAGAVCVIEPHPRRAALASELGADCVINPLSEDVPARVREACGSLGADVAFECAGVPDALEQAASLVRRGGSVGLIGLPTESVTISAANWLAREIELVASIGYLHAEFELAMQLAVSGRLKLAPLVSRTLPLRQLEDGFERLTSGAGDVKILIDPTNSAAEGQSSQLTKKSVEDKAA